MGNQGGAMLSARSSQGTPPTPTHPTRGVSVSSISAGNGNSRISRTSVADGGGGAGEDGRGDGESSSADRIQSLLRDQKDLSAQQLDSERRTKEGLVRELTDLTGMLKESTLQINRSVNVQNVQLSSIRDYAAGNSVELENQKKGINKRTQSMGMSLWTTVVLMVWVLGLFSATYMVIRLLPVPRTYGTCPVDMGVGVEAGGGHTPLPRQPPIPPTHPTAPIPAELIAVESPHPEDPIDDPVPTVPTAYTPGIPGEGLPTESDSA
eukprot:CAMPEP_0173356098 /NCGR_PEP_ID=MMETSP1144-20121109/18125_1 /TAXON_ID=483371 /ORGANISM="non described non described, Strain CCMP2298" /LENGTH=264 /DNA_ID=CAMNT_0014304867 /DNA_START=89 /DNA_END=880 /DNA_ORIENTATION=+